MSEGPSVYKGSLMSCSTVCPARSRLLQVQARITSVCRGLTAKILQEPRCCWAAGVGVQNDHISPPPLPDQHTHTHTHTPSPTLQYHETSSGHIAGFMFSTGPSCHNLAAPSGCVCVCVCGCVCGRREREREGGNLPRKGKMEVRGVWGATAETVAIG